MTIFGTDGAAAQDASSAKTIAPRSSLRAWENLSDEQTWQLLPDVKEGNKGRLPNWVKAVAIQMPRTAAAMLELDQAQRTLGPLDPALKARLRWIIARANRCSYAEALARSDLHMAGKPVTDVEKTLGDPTRWPSNETAEFRFVQMLTREAPAIPDNLFETLRQKLGDRGVAAVVLLTAYANFQDRLLLGLQVPLEPDGPLPLTNVTFAEKALQRTAILPPNNGKDVYQDNGTAVTALDPSWTSVRYDQLQASLERQRDRQPRLPIPDWEDVKQQLPPELGSRPTSIRWSLVTYGYAHNWPCLGPR